MKIDPYKLNICLRISHYSISSNSRYPATSLVDSLFIKQPSYELLYFHFDFSIRWRCPGSDSLSNCMSHSKFINLYHSLSHILLQFVDPKLGLGDRLSVLIFFHSTSIYSALYARYISRHSEYRREQDKSKLLYWQRQVSRSAGLDHSGCAVVPLITSLGEVLPLRGPLFPKFLSCHNHRSFKDIGVLEEARNFLKCKILG